MQLNAEEQAFWMTKKCEETMGKVMGLEIKDGLRQKR